MSGIRATGLPNHLDGPAVAAAASGLMLLPANAPRLVRLNRLAALGVSLADRGMPAATPSAIRAALKLEDIGGRGILTQEDPYSDVLVHSISFHGGPHLVASGSGERSVVDLENLLDAAFRDDWMPPGMRGPARQLTRALLKVSDIVLNRAGLARGTSPDGSTRTPVEVPSAAPLKQLTDATFLLDAELQLHGDHLRMVIDTFALDPGQLTDPCEHDTIDERLLVCPFLRVEGGYRVVLPLDLATTIRFHLLRFARQEDQLEELGRRYRRAVRRRFLRLLPPGVDAVLIEENAAFSRHLVKVAPQFDVHVVVATDPLVDTQPQVWGHYDTNDVLMRLEALIAPEERATYSTARDLLHLVITDSPGREAFWGVPNIPDIDPMLMARADDLEVMFHHEPDGLLGLLLFAQAADLRPGESMSTDILDEYSAYIDSEKSFYFSDDHTPTFTFFQPGDGLATRLKYQQETDRHGVIPPLLDPPVLQARRRYEKDAPEILIFEPTGTYLGYVVELDNAQVFIRSDLQGADFVGVELNLMESVAYWVRESARLVPSRATPTSCELVLQLDDPTSWTRVTDWSTTQPAVQTTPTPGGHVLRFTETFVALLQHETNSAERELVAVLITLLFDTADTPQQPALDAVAPSGTKRMINAFDQARSPDMLAKRLPRPLTGHDQVAAQLLDDLGAWLRSPTGGGYTVGELYGEDRVHALNKAVEHLFNRLEAEIVDYDARHLLDFLIAHNESLVHDAKFNELMLKSRLGCFGETSDTVKDLVEHRKDSATAQRASRFLIEYVAARPPHGERHIGVLDYYRILAIAIELIARATTSDFLHYQLADFQVSILGSGRLGVSRDEPVTLAMDKYAANSGTTSVRHAQASESTTGTDAFDVADFVARSEPATRAEFGFSLIELREVCGGLLDLAEADQVTRIREQDAITQVADARHLSPQVVSAVLSRITLTSRAEFLSIGADALPWRFNRDMSYVRRPIVLQGEDLVYGFRTLYRVGPYWLDNILSRRLQGKARTGEMRACISEARRKINDAFAHSVASTLNSLGMVTRTSVNKVGRRRIVDDAGHDLGDIDVLAADATTRTVLAVEAKDFEIARTPAEMANEVTKLFVGKGRKKSTVELHGKRLEWLQHNIDDVLDHLKVTDGRGTWRVVGIVVTSEPLITPLVRASPLPVVDVEELNRATLNLTPPGRGTNRRTNRRQLR